MTGRFPVKLFPPSEHQWQVAGQALMGGTPIAGAPQSADLATGGWWVCDYTAALMTRRPQISAWRALLGDLASGVRRIEVPVIDALQPWPAPDDFGESTSFSDGSTFDDGTEFARATIDAALAAAAYMPAWPAPAAAPTIAQIQIAVGAALNGGEYFSVIGPSGCVRLHMVTAILDVAGEVSTVRVTPPFRETMPEGTLVDFNDPRCTMKVDVASAKDAWPTMEVPWRTQPKIKFVESF